MENQNTITQNEVKTKKNGFGKKYLRPAIVGTLVLTALTGIIYPVATTLVANTLFPYESNGSQITVTLKDGTKRTYGSELIGQQYENPKYLFGRVNLGAPTNLNPTSDEYKKLVDERIKERQAKLAEISYYDNEKIPDELVTTSGSGVDPHISVETAYFQIGCIVKARENEENKRTEESVKKVIDRYTENPFLYIFGEKRVNVLMVNLALDGLI